MPANITPSDAWTDPITGPANGDPVDGDAGGPVFDMGQKLANRSEYISQRVGGLINGYRQYIPLHHGSDISAAWAMVAGATGWVRRQSDTAGAREMRWQVAIDARKAKLVSFVARIHGGATHAGVPATKPMLQAQGWDFVGGAAGFVYQQTDTVVTVPTYEADHLITLAISTGAPVTNDTNRLWWVSLFGETGANAVNDQLQLGALYAVLDRTP
jgi:hypothetical protein